ncbi:unnamed protein product [Linum tenue]|uniref:Uncharacterized protein n=1 Tax=Linum tenue TaxID=586396 RepID=A0AAV0H6I2_9ROSI|nr:unnamed protein product [Linum tenue]
MYIIDYAGDHSLERVYATEQLAFQPSNIGFVTFIPKVFFGVLASRSSGPEGLNSHVNEVLGLMAEPAILIFLMYNSLWLPDWVPASCIALAAYLIVNTLTTTYLLASRST